MPIPQIQRSLRLHTHPIQHLHQEPYPLKTFNYPANSKYIICHHLQRLFCFFLLLLFFCFFNFYWVSLCDHDLHMDRVQTTWKMSDSKLKRSSQPNWSCVATLKHQERGIFAAIARAKAGAAPRALGLLYCSGQSSDGPNHHRRRRAQSRTNEISTGTCPVT